MARNLARRTVIGALGAAALAVLALGDPQRAESYRLPAPAGHSPWPLVDWEALKAVNPDIIGWVSIPETEVSQPVLAARAADGQFYLSHDWEGLPSPAGAITLDGECGSDLFAENGVSIACLYGHHMADGSMFAPIASYSSGAWAEAHRTLHLQAPGRVVEYRFCFAEIVPGTQRAKRCRFESARQYRHWVEQRMDRAAVTCINAIPSRLLMLCTCSYTTYADERTLAYFEPIRAPAGPFPGSRRP